MVPAERVRVTAQKPKQMPANGKVAMIAATNQEIRPLVRHWKRQQREFDSKHFTFFESEYAVAVASGMGAEQGRRACEAVIALYSPSEVISVGFAGALDQSLSVGDVFTPRTVIDSRDGSRTDTHSGQGALISFPSVAHREQKARLADAYGAAAVDMEGASVAQGAEKHGLPYRAVKAISDDADFALPPVERFITHDGRFRVAPFVAFIAVRPWLWAGVYKLARNSSRAAENLCKALGEYCGDKDLRAALRPSPRGTT